MMEDGRVTFGMKSWVIILLHCLQNYVLFITWSKNPEIFICIQCCSHSLCIHTSVWE